VLLGWARRPRRPTRGAPATAHLAARSACCGLLLMHAAAASSRLLASTGRPRERMRSSASHAECPHPADAQLVRSTE
jgi:hypothetical protein